MEIKSKETKVEDVVIVDLDDYVSIKSEVESWDERVKHRCKLLTLSDSERSLDDLMKWYIQSLRCDAVIVRDYRTLKIYILNHMYLFKLCFMENCYSLDSYLDNMEDIIAFYSDLLLMTLPKWTPDKRYRKSLKNFARWLVVVIKTYLLDREDRALHVLMKIKLDESSQERKDFMNKLYEAFLLQEPTSKTDLAFCRTYILYQQWKRIRDRSYWQKMDEKIYSIYGRTAKDVSSNEILSQIILPHKKHVLDVLAHIKHTTEDMVNNYFKILRSGHLHEFESLKLDDFSMENEDEMLSAMSYSNGEEESFKEAYSNYCKTMSGAAQNNISDFRELKVETVADSRVAEIESDDDCQIVEITCPREYELIHEVSDDDDVIEIIMSKRIPTGPEKTKQEPDTAFLNSICPEPSKSPNGTTYSSPDTNTVSIEVPAAVGKNVTPENFEIDTTGNEDIQPRTPQQIDETTLNILTPPSEPHGDEPNSEEQKVYAKIGPGPNFSMEQDQNGLEGNEYERIKEDEQFQEMATAMNPTYEELFNNTNANSEQIQNRLEEHVFEITEEVHEMNQTPGPAGTNDSSCGVVKYPTENLLNNTKDNLDSNAVGGSDQTVGSRLDTILAQETTVVDPSQPNFIEHNRKGLEDNDLNILEESEQTPRLAEMNDTSCGIVNNTKDNLDSNAIGGGEQRVGSRLTTTLGQTTTSVQSQLSEDPARLNFSKQSQNGLEEGEQLLEMNQTPRPAGTNDTSCSIVNNTKDNLDSNALAGGDESVSSRLNIIPAKMTTLVQPHLSEDPARPKFPEPCQNRLDKQEQLHEVNQTPRPAGTNDTSCGIVNNTKDNLDSNALAGGNQSVGSSINTTPAQMTTVVQSHLSEDLAQPNSYEQNENVLEEDELEMRKEAEQFYETNTAWPAGMNDTSCGFVKNHAEDSNVVGGSDQSVDSRPASTEAKISVARSHLSQDPAPLIFFQQIQNRLEDSEHEVIAEEYGQLQEMDHTSVPAGKNDSSCGIDNLTDGVLGNTTDNPHINQSSGSDQNVSSIPTTSEAHLVDNIVKGFEWSLVSSTNYGANDKRKQRFTNLSDQTFKIVEDNISDMPCINGDVDYFYERVQEENSVITDTSSKVQSNTRRDYVLQTSVAVVEKKKLWNENDREEKIVYTQNIGKKINDHYQNTKVTQDFANLLDGPVDNRINVSETDLHSEDLLRQTPPDYKSPQFEPGLADFRQYYKENASNITTTKKERNGLGSGTQTNDKRKDSSQKKSTQQLKSDLKKRKIKMRISKKKMNMESLQYYGISHDDPCLQSKPYVVIKGLSDSELNLWSKIKEKSRQLRLEKERASQKQPIMVATYDKSTPFICAKDMLSIDLYGEQSVRPLVKEIKQDNMKRSSKGMTVEQFVPTNDHLEPSQATCHSEENLHKMNSGLNYDVCSYNLGQNVVSESFNYLGRSTTKSSDSSDYGFSNNEQFNVEYCRELVSPILDESNRISMKPTLEETKTTSLPPFSPTFSSLSNSPSHNLLSDYVSEICHSENLDGNIDHIFGTERCEPIVQDDNSMMNTVVLPSENTDENSGFHNVKHLQNNYDINNTLSKLDLEGGKTCLPLKKRKLSVANANENEYFLGPDVVEEILKQARLEELPKEEIKEEISYPAKPMISIAEIQENLKEPSTRTFRTPAERKEMPPSAQHKYTDHAPLQPPARFFETPKIVTEQYNNHTYNNPTINYHMNNVPYTFLPCTGFQYFPQIILPMTGASSFDVNTTFNTQSPVQAQGCAQDPYMKPKKEKKRDRKKKSY